MKAEEFMQQIQKVNSMLENKRLEKEQLMAIATGTTVQIREKVQTSGTKQKMAEAVNSYVDLENGDIKELIKQREEVIRVIEKLNAKHYDVLHKIYVQNIDLTDLAAAYDKSYSWATTTKARALDSLQKLLDERKRE